MSTVQLNADELKGFIRHMVANNQYIQSQGKVPVALNLVGEAGLGKTSIIQQVAKESNLQYVKLNLAQLEEIGD